MGHASVEAGKSRICRTRQAGDPGKRWGHSWSPKSIQGQNSLFLGDIRVFSLKAFNWLFEAHPRNGRSSIFSKSAVLNVNHTLKITSQQYLDRCLTKQLGTIVQPSGHEINHHKRSNCHTINSIHLKWTFKINFGVCVPVKTSPQSRERTYSHPSPETISTGPLQFLHPTPPCPIQPWFLSWYVSLHFLDTYKNGLIYSISSFFSGLFHSVKLFWDSSTLLKRSINSSFLFTAE